MNECGFCTDLKRLRQMETTLRYSNIATETRSVKVQPVIAITTKFDDGFIKYEIFNNNRTFEIVFCPVCGREIKK